MAGSQDASENPVAINVVPMVDVIFCLCVFFMCSFKFKELEGKFESWLPKDKGLQSSSVPDLIEEIRVAILWDEPNQQSVRLFGKQTIQNDAQLQTLIRDAYADAVRRSKPDQPVIIDPDKRVPWKEVVNVINLAKREKINKIEFAFGDSQAPPNLQVKTK